MINAEYTLETPIESIFVVNNIPTADVVRVVRCKDCKHYVNDRLKKDYSEDERFKRRVCVASEYAILRDPNWFCADGERRE